MPKDKPPENDKDLFRRMMSGVKPLDAEERVQPEKPDISPHHKTRSPEDDIQTDFAELSHVSPVTPEESLFFARSGLQQRTLKQLKRGDMRIDARLDLHGETIAEAGILLTQFLEQAQNEGCRYVIVIHGKGHRSAEGKPILKAQVNHWLRDSPAVLAFCSALPKHGGTGALYVLLKKQQ